MRRNATILLAVMWLMLGIAPVPGRGSDAANSAPAAKATSPGAPAPAAAVAPVLVSNVTVDQQPTGVTVVEVKTSGTPDYRVMRLSDPPRLVIDIQGARNRSPQQQYLAGTSVLKDIRVAQFRSEDPSIVRVVADLNGKAAMNVHATSGYLRLELRPSGTASAAVDKATGAEPKRSEIKSASITTTPAHPPAVQHSMPVSTQRRSDNVAGAPKTADQGPAPATASKDKLAEQAPQTNNKTSAPALTSEVIPPSPPTAPPVQADPAKPQVQGTLPTDTSKDAVAAPVPPPASVTPEALRAKEAAKILNPANPAAQVAASANPLIPPADGNPVYTGEPISLNLKEVDLKDFFRLVHEISGLNIIIDPNVNGSVTLVLDSVPWDQALDIVLKDNELGKVLEGNVLRIARMSTLTAEQEELSKLALARINAAPLVTVFRPVNYAKAAEIAQLLTKWAGGGGGGAMSKRGTVLVDTRNNTLVISDVQSQIPIIENVIDKMDKKTKQISIEARVVLATAQFTRTLSSNLLGGFVNNHTTAAGNSGLSNTTTQTSIPAPTTFPLTTPAVTTSPAASTGFGIAAITNAGANYYINAVLTAAEERDQAKTISRPSIVTQNNVQGKVQQGVQVPIQTTINNTISVQYYPATLQMTVTPQVTDDGNIFMVIDVQNNSVGASVSGIGPEIATQQATTSVLVPDGGTVVFGGITVTTRSKTLNYIPVLGNIPLLGNLFKNSNVQDQDQELLFFVSPKILVS